MFNSKHYIPILKWKPAERQALKNLGENEKKFLTPLIQLVMPQPKLAKSGEMEKSIDEQFDEVVEAFKVKMLQVPEEILNYWGKSPIFIDVNLIYTPDLKTESIKQILEIGKELDLFLIPVINLSSDNEVKKVASELAKKYNGGLCLRLSIADFSDEQKLHKDIKELLDSYSLSEKDVDLSIDLKDRNDKYQEIINLSQNIPNLKSWRTFIFASGAFPIDLSECVLGENDIPRRDWTSWLDQAKTNNLQRIPSFSDYATQHPIYKESVRFFTPSASIRYTLDEKWLIMRGQKGKSSQYLANAQLLSQDQKFNGLFRGAKFSFGDAYIVEKGKDLKSSKTGNATTWLTAGINHHLAYVSFQISNLS